MFACDIYSLDICNNSLNGSDSSPWASQWAATQERHSNASISGGVTWHRAGISLWGLWVTFDYSSRRARCAALMEKRRVSWECQHDWDAHVRGKSGPCVEVALSFCQTHRRVQIKVLADTISRGVEGCVLNTLINLHWRILNCMRQRK